MVRDLLQDDDIPAKEKIQRMDDIYSWLAIFVWRANTTLLELALWKNAMQNASTVKEYPSPSIEEQQRNDFRFTCGIEVVSSNVLSFLDFDTDLEKVIW